MSKGFGCFVIKQMLCYVLRHDKRFIMFNIHGWTAKIAQIEFYMFSGFFAINVFLRLGYTHVILRLVASSYMLINNESLVYNIAVLGSPGLSGCHIQQ